MAIRQGKTRPRGAGRMIGGGNLRRQPRFTRGSAPSPPPPPDWRSQIEGWSGANFVGGAWLIIAPWVLGYSATGPRWNDFACGIVIGVLALVRATGAYRADWLSWINALVGFWVFVAAFTIDNTPAARWNDIIVGLAVLLLALASAQATENLFRPRRGGPPVA